jgi:hypothetical protein
MAYYCGTCGSKLRSERIKGGDSKTGTTRWISYKVLFAKTLRAYKCPNGCELKKVTGSG